MRRQGEEAVENEEQTGMKEKRKDTMLANCVHRKDRNVSPFSYLFPLMHVITQKGKPIRKIHLQLI